MRFPVNCSLTIQPSFSVHRKTGAVSSVMRMISMCVLGKAAEPMAKMGRNWGRERRGELEKLVVEYCILVGVLMSEVGAVREKNNAANST